MVALGPQTLRFLVMGEYVSVTVNVTEEKTKEKKSLPWFLRVIREKCGKSGKSFAQT